MIQENIKLPKVGAKIEKYVFIGCILFLKVSVIIPPWQPLTTFEVYRN